jgi:hypothetical protein
MGCRRDNGINDGILYFQADIFSLFLESLK